MLSTPLFVVEREWKNANRFFFCLHPSMTIELAIFLFVLGGRMGITGRAFLWPFFHAFRDT